MHLTPALLLLLATAVTADKHNYCRCTKLEWVESAVPTIDVQQWFPDDTSTKDIATKYPGWVLIETSGDYEGWAHNTDPNGIIGGDAFYGACLDENSDGGSECN